MLPTLTAHQTAEKLLCEIFPLFSILFFYMAQLIKIFLHNSSDIVSMIHNSAKILQMNTLFNIK